MNVSSDSLTGVGAAGLSGGPAKLGDKLFSSSGAHATPSKINMAGVR